MTIEEKREAIRSEVIAAIPDIVELKFGCIVELDENTSLRRRIQGRITSEMHPYQDERMHRWTIKPDKKNKPESFGKNDKTGEYTNNAIIIGRPILAFDILRSLGEHKHGIWSIDGAGMLVVMYSTKIVPIFKVDVETPLSKWGPEIINKLYDLFHE